MRLLPLELLEAFAASEEGTRMWLPGLGRSMAPLLRSGDAIQVERSATIQRGDIVLLRTSRDLLAHVVESVSPLRTTNLRGRPDEAPGELLGRVVALRRSGRVIRVTRARQELLRFAVITARALRSSDLLTRSVRQARSALFGRRTAAARSLLLGDIVVRQLRRDDVERTLRFCGDHLDLSAELILRQLAHRWNDEPHSFGAFAKDGALVGFSFVDEYAQEGVDLPGEWVRYHFVAPIARHLGVGERLASALLDAAASRGLAHVFADVHADNPAGLGLFEGLGFVRDDAQTAAVNRVRRALGEAYIALRKDL